MDAKALFQWMFWDCDSNVIVTPPKRSPVNVQPALASRGSIVAEVVVAERDEEV